MNVDCPVAHSYHPHSVPQISKSNVINDTSLQGIYKLPYSGWVIVWSTVQTNNTKCVLKGILIAVCGLKVRQTCLFHHLNRAWGHRQLAIGSAEWLDLKFLLGRYKWWYWIDICEWGIRKLRCWILWKRVWPTWHCPSVQSFRFRRCEVCLQNVISAFILLILGSGILSNAGLTDLLGP